MSNYTDRSITCKDCKLDFIFSAGEQEFYETKGFQDPARCKTCRDARKIAKQVKEAVSAGESNTTSSQETVAQFWNEEGEEQPHRQRRRR